MTNKKCPRVVWEWGGDARLHRYRLVDLGSEGGSVHYNTERLSRDALGQQKWDYVQVDNAYMLAALFEDLSRRTS